MKKSRVIFSLIIISLVSIIFGSYGATEGYLDFLPYVEDEKTTQSDEFLVSKYNVDLGLFWVVWDALENDYLREDNIDVDKMRYGAIKGMVEALDDPYTLFMDPEETDSFISNLEGKLEGIGAELTVDEGRLTIVTPLKDSPAERAGLLPGDIIYKVEDEFASELTLFEAIMEIRGDKGTPVNLTIIRDKRDDPFTVTIVRAKIDIDSVTYEEIEDDVHYISINQFSDSTASEFSDVVGDLILADSKGMIIDLRYNGGGYLDAAIDVLSDLLPEDVTAAATRDRDGEKNAEIYYTDGGLKILDIPLIVLVNSGSASASEIVAGALQDHERGVIMGTQTYGKGTVQAVEFLEDGSSLRVTIASWYTPEDRVIDGVGITPDILVQNFEDDIKNDFDRQLDEAVKYLNNL